MPREEENPSANEHGKADAPESQNQKNNASKDDRYPNSMQNLIPRIGVLVVVLGHVFREGWQSGSLASAILYTALPPNEASAAQSLNLSHVPSLNLLLIGSTFFRVWQS